MIDKTVSEIYNHVLVLSNDIEKRYSISQSHFKKLYNDPQFPKDSFDRLERALMLQGPLTKKPENSVWPFLAIRYFNQDNDLVMKLLFILVYKLWNSAIQGLFPRGIDKTIYEFTLSGLSQKSYLKKYDSVSAVLQVITESMMKRLAEGVKQDKPIVETIALMVSDARNRTRQILKAFMISYYESWKKIKQDPSLVHGEKKEREDVDARLRNYMTVFLGEKPEVKKNITSMLARKVGIRPLLPFYVVSVLTDDDVSVIVPIFEKIMTDSHITDQNLVYKFAKSSRYQKDREALYSLVERKVQTNDVAASRFQALAVESQKKVAHIVLLTLYIYLKQLHRVKSGKEIS